MSLLLSESIFEPRHRFAASLIAVVALSACIVIQKLSGNYGYVAILNFTLVDGPLHERAPNLVFNLSGYLKLFVHETIQVLGENYESALFLLASSLLTAVCFRASHASSGSLRGTGHVPPMLILSSGMLLFLIVRFALFPAPWARYMLPTYVLAGILFARPTHTQQIMDGKPGA